MATQAEVNALTDCFIEVFGRDTKLIKASLEAIRINTDKVTIDNKVAEIRKEIAAFVEAKEAIIQELLGMK